MCCHVVGRAETAPVSETLKRTSMLEVRRRVSATEGMIMETTAREALRKTTRLGRIFIGLCLLICPIARAAEQATKTTAPLNISMTGRHWAIVHPAEEITFYRESPDIAFVTQEGIPQGLLVVKKGAARLKDVIVRNGTIEYDMKPIDEGMAAVMFRRKDLDSAEVLYVRVSANCPVSQDCLQYAPIMNGDMLWDAYPQYQRPAPIDPNGWNHFRIVLSGRRMNVFVNGAVKPTLSVGHLESSAVEGQLELLGPATYANLRISQGAVEHLSPTPLRDATASDPKYVRNWQVSPFTVLPAGRDIRFLDRPESSARWRNITTEQNGAINLTRIYKTPDPGQLRCVSWLTTDIESSLTQQKTMSIGWLREIWVFVNGKLVFSGRNFWDPPGPKLTPDGRLSLENGSVDLPLRQGHNQIDIAISNENSDSNTHYGWGLQLKANDLRGIALRRSSAADSHSSHH